MINRKLGIDFKKFSTREWEIPIGIFNLLIQANLHCQFFSDDNYTKDFGAMWCEIFNSKKEKLKNIIKKDWWEYKREDLLINSKKHTASYVYNIETISKRISDLKSLQDIKRINYAIKANPNIDIIRNYHGDILAIPKFNIRSI